MGSNVFTCLGFLNAQELSPTALYLQNEVVHNYMLSLRLFCECCESAPTCQTEHPEEDAQQSGLSGLLRHVAFRCFLCSSQSYSVLILLFRSLSQVLGFGLLTIPLDLTLSSILCITAMSGLT